MPNSQPPSKPAALQRLPQPELRYAISIKQPWAALIVHGIKTVEVRSWPALRRGPLLIHASKTPELDPAAWGLLTTPEVEATATLIGGVIGQVELVDCIDYATREAFTADAARHKAGEHWWKPIRHGFVLAKPHRLEFVPWPGNTNFFGVTAVFKVLKPPKAKIAKPKAVAKTVIVRLPESPPQRQTRQSASLIGALTRKTQGRR
jgi:hypothetical protein